MKALVKQVCEEYIGKFNRSRLVLKVKFKMDPSLALSKR